MKGGIACALAAVLDHIGQHTLKGSIAFLISGDEEGIAVNGTPKLLQWAAERGEKFDHCILGEPSNQEELGDTIKIGRRGSLNGHLIVQGKQGHVAYPQRAENPIRGLVKLIDALQAKPLDRGSKQFSPSHLEFTSVDVGNMTVNLIPGEARARFNIRFNDKHITQLAEEIDRAARRQSRGQEDKVCLRVGAVERRPYSSPSPARSPTWWRAPSKASPAASRSFPPPAALRMRVSSPSYCPVVEFGLVGQTMHAVDERVPIADLRALTIIYRRIIERYFG